MLRGTSILQMAHAGNRFQEKKRSRWGHQRFRLHEGGRRALTNLFYELEREMNAIRVVRRKPMALDML